MALLPRRVSEQLRRSPNAASTYKFAAQRIQRFVDQTASQFLLRFTIEIRVADHMHDAIAQYQTIRAHHFSDG